MQVRGRCQGCGQPIELPTGGAAPLLCGRGRCRSVSRSKGAA
ncbi:hypothetical protein TOK_0176 [Pseudonocardia sp. N23]|nr:hypothetical protein TOK_0176 [Pseudonocardia sp. N23]